MDLAPVFYALLIIIFVVVILRLRKIAITSKKNEPRRPRRTYKKARL